MDMRLWPARCRSCRQRRTFRVEPIGEVCQCGGLYVVDKYRKQAEHKRNACYCDGYAWSMTNGPHRKGSPKCVHAASPLVPDISPVYEDWANDFPF